MHCAGSPTCRCPVILVGTGTWDPHWSPHVPTLLDVPILTPTERKAVWMASLHREPVAQTGISSLDDGAVPVHFVLGPRSGRPGGPGGGRLGRAGR